MSVPLLTWAETVVVVLSVIVVLAAVAVTWLALRVVRLKRELDDLRARTAPAAPESRARAAATWAMRTVLDAPTRVRERGFFEGVLMAPIEDLARIAREDRDRIVAISGPDGTVAVMFSDIEGSTRLNQELGDEAFVNLLAEHDRMVRAQVKRRGGHVVKSQGDGFMAVFGDAEDAVRAAVAIRSKAASAGRHARRTPLRVRIGLNCGPVVSRDGDYFGTNVAKAARIAALADGDQILLAREVADALAAVSAPGGLSAGSSAGSGDAPDVEPVGTYELRGLTGEHEVYAVRTPR